MSRTINSEKRKLTESTEGHWESVGDENGAEADYIVDELPDKRTQAETSVVNGLGPVTISDKATCLGCGLSFDSFQEQRLHFSSDLHRYNTQRRDRGRRPVSEPEFEALIHDDGFSDGSISASEDEILDDEESDAKWGSGFSATAARSVRIEFTHPFETGKYISLYKVALPDQTTLGSLRYRGPWAVIMSGGGHFAAAIWNSNGICLCHKTFHRYTTRKKQGGSQAAADASSGRRIRSAGATLRRHGEQQLKNQVRSLFSEWSNTFLSVQCVYIRVSSQQRKDLLLGWEGSPIAPFAKDGRMRNIPFPTRRATQKEVCRVYDNLISYVVSSESLCAKPSEFALQRDDSRATSIKPKPQLSSVPTVKEKGTAHLKKRGNTDGDKDGPGQITDLGLSNVNSTQCPGEKDDFREYDEKKIMPLDENFLILFKACLAGDLSTIENIVFGRDDSSKTCEKDIVFHRGYFSGTEYNSQTTEDLGLVGVAAVAGNVAAIEWLLEHGVSPCVGASPYLATKSKSARTALRKFWGSHPGMYNYEEAGIPSPITEEDASRLAEKKRLERLKKRDKKDGKLDSLKPPGAISRELRAVAAERRLLGNCCAQCKNSLEGMIPFERLSFRYCSTDCVHKHRAALAKDSKRRG